MNGPGGKMSSAEPYTARGVYKGPQHYLNGRTADLTVYPETGRVLASFDDTGALGMAMFAAEHFEITRKP